MDAYTEVGGRATQDAKAEGEGTTPWMGEIELRQEQQSGECLDDYRDIGGSESLEHFLEHILEVERRRRPKPRINLNIPFRSIYCILINPYA